MSANATIAPKTHSSDYVPTRGSDAALIGLVSGLLVEIQALRGEVAELSDRLNDGGKPFPLSTDRVCELLGRGRASVREWFCYPDQLHAAIQRDFEPVR